MSVEWFDLGLRLAARERGGPVERLRHAPVAPGAARVWVAASEGASGVQVRAAVPGGPVGRADGGECLDLLGALGVSIAAPEPVPLVVEDESTLPALVALARASDPASSRGVVAAHVGWWAERSDFPSGRAVLDVVQACRSRWVLGLAPSAERSLSVWAQGVEDERAPLMLAELVSAGSPLPLLAVLVEDELASWEYAQTAHAEGRDWRHPDGTGRAALGLRSRCDAADVYAAALLSDPLYRERAVHTGHVVIGRVVEASGRRIGVECARLDARLRPGSQVHGWVGGVAGGSLTFGGEVLAASVNGGRLVLSVAVVGALPGHGDAVTLHDAPPNVGGQVSGRSRYRWHYAARRSWLTTGRAPVAARREVPLSVLVAGASDDGQEDQR